jgi:hypothetical protein
MRISRPSPALIVAIVALVMSTTGSAMAAVNFARNAGAVDKKSAVGAGSSLNRAAGKLVATSKGGKNKGQIPWKFLGDVANADNFAVPFLVQDNATGANVALDTTGFGRFEASCRDEQSRAGVENPSTFITFASTSTLPMNVARRVGNGNGTVRLLAPGTVDTFEIAASNTFEYHLQQNQTHVLIQGAVRQDRPTTADGRCLVWGSVQVVKDSDV